jgi:hypothetical protein
MEILLATNAKGRSTLGDQEQSVALMITARFDRSYQPSDLPY